MKNIFFVVLAITIGWTTNYAQTKAPKTVVTAFESKFPKATHVTWDKENSKEYEAEFQWNGAKHSANFSLEGIWLETETTISFEKLPAGVQQSFLAKHKAKKVKAVAKIETSKGETFFEIEVKKGVATKEYLYTSAGILKTK